VESLGLEPCHVEGGEPRKLGCKPQSTSSPARGRRLPVQAHLRLTVHRTQDTGGMCASIRLPEAGGQSMPGGPGRGDVRVHGGGGEGEGSVETSGGMGDGGGGRLAGNRTGGRMKMMNESPTAIAWRSWGSAGGCRGWRGERALVETGDEARTRHSDDGRRSRVLQGMGRPETRRSADETTTDVACTSQAGCGRCSLLTLLTTHSALHPLKHGRHSRPTVATNTWSTAAVRVAVSAGLHVLGDIHTAPMATKRPVRASAQRSGTTPNTATAFIFMPLPSS